MNGEVGMRNDLNSEGGMGNADLKNDFCRFLLSD